MNIELFCNWCGKWVDPEGHRWACGGKEPDDETRRARAEAVGFGFVETKQ